MCGNIITAESLIDETWLKSGKGLNSYYRKDKEGPRWKYQQHYCNELHFFRKTGRKVVLPQDLILYRQRYQNTNAQKLQITLRLCCYVEEIPVCCLRPFPLSIIVPPQHA